MPTENNVLGSYVVGLETTAAQSDFNAFFNVVGRYSNNFDAQIQLIKSLNANFDASVIVYIDEQKPLVDIIDPAVPLVSGSAGVTLNFEASASGLDGKNIAFTSWIFSDVPTTSGSVISSSGTYTTSHTFPYSGIFDVVFMAIDDRGVVNSDRVKIDTTSGVTVCEITLEATPESGVAPLEIAFSGIITSEPYPLVEKYILFGDGTVSASTTSILKVYPAIGCYVPIFRARDSRGIIVTDTTVVGPNS